MKKRLFIILLIGFVTIGLLYTGITKVWAQEETPEAPQEETPEAPQEETKETPAEAGALMTGPPEGEPVTGATSKGVYTGNVAYDVNKFTGNLQLISNLITLPGRNGLDLNLKVSYDSGSHEVDWIGLGWNLNLGYIKKVRTRYRILYEVTETEQEVDEGVTCDFNHRYGSNQEVTKYYLVLPGTSSELIQAPDGRWRCKYAQGLKIEHSGNQWVVYTRDGTKYTLTQQYTYDDVDTTVIDSPTKMYIYQDEYLTQWNVTSVRDTNNNGINISYQYNGKYLTSCQIQDSVGNSIHFNTSSSGYEEPSRTLREIVIKDEADQEIAKFRFDYQPLTTTRSPREGSWDQEGGSRPEEDIRVAALKSITRISPTGESLPPVSFEYQTGSTYRERPNVIKMITYPSGGIVSFSYERYLEPVLGWRVREKIIEDGLGHLSTYSYSYSEPFYLNGGGLFSFIIDYTNSDGSWNKSDYHFPNDLDHGHPAYYTGQVGHSQTTVTDPEGNRSISYFYTNENSRSEEKQASSNQLLSKCYNYLTSVADEWLTECQSGYDECVETCESECEDVCGGNWDCEDQCIEGCLEESECEANYDECESNASDYYNEQVLPTRVSVSFSTRYCQKTHPYAGLLKKVEQYEGGELVKSVDYGVSVETIQADTNPNDIRDSAIYAQHLTTQTATISGKTYRAQYQDYDEYQNPQHLIDEGDLSDPTDDRHTYLTYLYETSSIAQGKHLIGLVTQEEVRNGSGSLLVRTNRNYDENNGNLLSGTFYYPSGATGTTSFTYDEYGNLITKTDPKGNTTTYEYSPAYNSAYLTEETNPLWILYTKTHQKGTGLVLTQTDQNGHTTTNTYDGFWRPIRIERDNGAVTTYEYDLSSVPNRITITSQINDSLNQNITTLHDGLGRLIRTERYGEGSPITTVITYDSVGNRHTVTDPEGKTTTYDYDALKRIKSITYPDGSGETYAYEGSLVRVTDSNGKVTEYTYNSDKKLIQVHDASGHDAYYGYDLLGNLTQIRDPRGLVTSYQYWLPGKVSQTTYPDGTTYHFTYDANSNLIQRIDAKEEVTNYTYDSLNRMLSVSYLVHPDYNVAYTYDEGENGKGNLTQVTDPSGTSIYTYDSQGRVISITKNTLGRDYTTSYIHDYADNITSITHPDGRIVSSTYNSLNRLTTTKWQNNPIATFTYYNIGALKDVTYSNGFKSTYTYDNRNRMATLNITNPGGQEVFKHNYEYDLVGNRTRLTTLKDVINYSYDELYRLTGVDYRNALSDLSYTYDESGNRLSFKSTIQSNGKNLADIGYEYASDSNKLLKITGPTHGDVYFDYDENGNQTGKTHMRVGTSLGDASHELRDTSYTYDPEDRLIQVNDGDGEVSFTYDANGRRITKTHNSQTTLYHYDWKGNVLSKTDAEGNLKALYIYGFKQKIAEITGETGLTFFHTDALGSTALLTNESAEIIQEYDYGPFGNIMDARGYSDNSYRFTGKETDFETGLIYFGARYYDPGIGRFITVDPAGPHYNIPQSLDRYTYCLNNPLKYIDPTGEYTAIFNGFQLFNKKGEIEWMSKVAEALDARGVRHPTVHRWPGGGTQKAFKAAAETAALNIAYEVKTLKKTGMWGEGETVNLLAHSYGSNVARLTGEILEKRYGIEVHRTVLLDPFFRYENTDYMGKVYQLKAGSCSVGLFAGLVPGSRRNIDATVITLSGYNHTTIYDYEDSGLMDLVSLLLSDWDLALDFVHKQVEGWETEYQVVTPDRWKSE